MLPATLLHLEIIKNGSINMSYICNFAPALNVMALKFFPGSLSLLL